MNERKNAVIGQNELEDDCFDFDELEKRLETGLENSLSEFDFLEKDKAKIGNPESLGNAVMNVVWEQFIYQIGLIAGEDFIQENKGLTLDLRDEAHIQTAENFAVGNIAFHNTEIDYQKRYDDWQSNFKKNEAGQVIKKMDKRSGKEKEVLVHRTRAAFDKDRPKGSAQEHMDHTVSAGEIIRDPAANAFMTKEQQIEFANSEKNLNPLDASANESKGDSTMTEWLDSERNGEKPADRFNIDEKKLREKDREAREEYKKQKEEGEKRSEIAGKKSQRAEAFRIGGKALRTAVMGLLAELIRNIITKLVIWLKSKEKSLKTFLNQIQEAIQTFIINLKNNLLTAGTTAVSTVVTAILGPVAGTIQKIWILIKQGGKSVREAVDYIKAPENRKKSFGVLMLETGKIVMTGLTAMGALVLGDVIEKGLMAFPAFAAEIPLIGSLANIIGIFLGAVVAGIAGALILNLIDKLIAKKQSKEITERQIEKGKEVLAKQNQVMAVNQEKLRRTKAETIETIRERHKTAAKIMKNAVDYIFSENDNDNDEILADINSVLDEI